MEDLRLKILISALQSISLATNGALRKLNLIQAETLDPSTGFETMKRQKMNQK